MRDIFVSLCRSIRSLLRLDVFGHLIWPSVVSALLWFIVAFLSWAALVDVAMDAIKDTGWVGQQITTSTFLAAITLFMVKVIVMLAYVPLFYVTSIILVAVIAMPLMLERVAARDYADLEQRHGGSNTASLLNTLLAALCFVLFFLLSLPLWFLVPGFGLIVPILLTGWFNQRIFAYDALMRHADRDELVRLRKELRPKLLLLGCGTTLFAYVPVINVIAPAFSGLAFVHFLLEALRQERCIDILE